jgi:hypothetical protein
LDVCKSGHRDGCEDGPIGLTCANARWLRVGMGGGVRACMVVLIESMSACICLTDVCVGTVEVEQR